jgi:adenine-specific DNA-methyltransferase
MLQSQYLDSEFKKKGGVFYTPQYLANYVAQRMLSFADIKNNSPDFSVLDPACGDGMLLNAFLNKFNQRNSNNKLKILGTDIDGYAINISDNYFKNKSNANFKQINALQPYDNQQVKATWLKIQEDVFKSKTIDFIISNPPWGADLTALNKDFLHRNYKVAHGQFNSYDLFVELILNILSPNGYYALILPDSIFNIEHSRIRKQLLDTKILMIARLGEKIFTGINRACSIIIGQKTKPTEQHLVSCFHLSKELRIKVLNNDLTLDQAEKALSHIIPQARFAENPQLSFDIDLRKRELSIVDKIEKNAPPLSIFTKNTRGVELSKHGKVCECPKCEKWFPLPIVINNCPHCKVSIKDENIKRETIIYNRKKENTLQLKAGEDLFRFNSFSNKWIDVTKKGINYKNLSIYEGTKILVRKTGVGITASLDYDNALSNQVVYILQLRKEFQDKLTLEFLLALINSRVITYYLLKKYGETEWRTHPYLTQGTVNSLPMPHLDFKDETLKESILTFSNRIKTEVINSKKENISVELDRDLEYFIGQLYGLNKKDYVVIFQELKAAEQLIPLKRLLLDITAETVFQV